MGITPEQFKRMEERLGRSPRAARAAFEPTLQRPSTTHEIILGLDPSLLLHRAAGPPSEAEIAFVRPLVEKASLALCINEAWAMLAAVALIGLVLLVFTRASKP